MNEITPTEAAHIAGGQSLLRLVSPTQPAPATGRGGVPPVMPPIAPPKAPGMEHPDA